MVAAALIGIALDENRHATLRRVAMASGREEKLADFGPLPAAFDLANSQGTYWYRGFSMNPDGKSFITSVYRLQVHLWLTRDFDRPAQLFDLLPWKR